MQIVPIRRLVMKGLLLIALAGAIWPQSIGLVPGHITACTSLTCTLDATSGTGNLLVVGMVGWLNIVGGCCGTTDAHIQAIAQMAEGKRPRRVPDRARRSYYSGIDLVEADPASGTLIVGERTHHSLEMDEEEPLHVIDCFSEEDQSLVILQIADMLVKDCIASSSYAKSVFDLALSNQFSHWPDQIDRCWSIPRDLRINSARS